MKKFIFYILILILGIVTAFTYVMGSLHYFLFSPAPVFQQSTKTIMIESGLSGRAIVGILQREGIITQPELFLGGWKLRFGHKSFQAGEYTFRKTITPLEIMMKLIRGQVILHALTIPEGWEKRQIAALVEQRYGLESHLSLTIMNKVTLLKKYGVEGPSLEGFLYPDTYHFPRKVTSEIIIQTMVSRFFDIFTEQYKHRAQELGYSILELCTLASLIEREAAIAEERPLISAVYHNRLEKKMRLQCDPTVIYALPHFTGNLTKKDLAFDSPYNTYKYGGLPPGPICNPGHASIQAALYPAQVPYLYFVAKGDKSGRHVFSKSLRDHNRAVYNEQIRPRRRKK
ncbi:endolytic transglycosylase MltG [candidate division CSSED10-310 bacterium]|uniref:Endolytic murein transglycosylase n=1 Tax=candidate division CSSED10-310 bacterium TaxID=2855610 RepID=A0ABV6YZI3_UNCC1